MVSISSNNSNLDTMIGRVQKYFDCSILFFCELEEAQCQGALSYTLQCSNNKPILNWIVCSYLQYYYQQQTNQWSTEIIGNSVNVLLDLNDGCLHQLVEAVRNTPSSRTPGRNTVISTYMDKGHTTLTLVFCDLQLLKY